MAMKPITSGRNDKNGHTEEKMKKKSSTSYAAPHQSHLHVMWKKKKSDILSLLGRHENHVNKDVRRLHFRNDFSRQFLQS